jgi:PmbA protein
MAQTDPYMLLAEKTLQRAQQLGAEWCDVSVGSGRHTSVSLEKTAVKSADSGRTESASVRAFIGGAMGYAVCGGLGEDRVMAAATRAVDMAREGSADPDFKALPSPETAPTVEGLFDPALAGMTVDDVVALAVANIRLAREMEPEVNLSGHVSLSAGESVLASSTGIRIEKRRTSLDADIEALVVRGDDRGFYYDFDSGRMLDDCDTAVLARAAIEGARRMLGARRIGSGRMPVVLGPLSASDFVSDLIASANAESIQRGRSYLCGKMGQAIAGDVLTVTDDGLVDRGLYSGPCDGEGTPRRCVKVIDQGTFAAQLHSSYTAGKAGEPNTGHGSRSGGIQHTNLDLVLGDRTAEEIIRDTGDGLYFAISHFTPNPTSGDLSASVDFGFRLAGGEIAYPVERAMVAGNMLDLASRIDAVSSDYREEPGNRLPTVRIQDVQIAGTE